VPAGPGRSRGRRCAGAVASWIRPGPGSLRARAGASAFLPPPETSLPRPRTSPELSSIPRL